MRKKQKSQEDLKLNELETDFKKDKKRVETELKALKEKYKRDKREVIRDKKRIRKEQHQKCKLKKHLEDTMPQRLASELKLIKGDNNGRGETISDRAFRRDQARIRILNEFRSRNGNNAQVHGEEAEEIGQDRVGEI